MPRDTPARSDEADETVAKSSAKAPESDPGGEKVTVEALSNVWIDGEYRSPTWKGEATLTTELQGLVDANLAKIVTED